MAVGVVWDNDEKTVLLISFPKYWEWEEVYAAEHLGNQYTATVDHEVIVIHDMCVMLRWSPNAFAHMRPLLIALHPRMKVHIFVGMNSLVRAIWNTFTDLYAFLACDRIFHFVETLDEARHLAYQMQQTQEQH